MCNEVLDFFKASSSVPKLQYTYEQLTCGPEPGQFDSGRGTSAPRRPAQHAHFVVLTHA